jgi:hypothetical protein
MKKILIALNVMFASVIYFQNCTPQKMIVGAIQGSNKNWHCVNYNDSTYNGIPLSVSRIVYDKYTNIQYSKILATAPSLTTMTEDSRCVWFSLDVIKKFIYKVEDTLYRKGFNKNTRLGLRMYFATYPDTTGMQNNQYLDGLPLEYANHHTLFIVPTFDSTSAGASKPVHYDFNAFKGVSTNSTPFINTSPLQKSIPSFWNEPFACLLITDDIYMQNHGEVGPPPSPVPGAIF